LLLKFRGKEAFRSVGSLGEISTTAWLKKVPVDAQLLPSALSAPPWQMNWFPSTTPSPVALEFIKEMEAFVNVPIGITRYVNIRSKLLPNRLPTAELRNPNSRLWVNALEVGVTVILAAPISGAPEGFVNKLKFEKVRFPTEQGPVAT